MKSIFPMTRAVTFAFSLAVSAAAPAATWTADNGNGTFSNPLFFEEFSDPDMIRVGDDYYFTGTTMHAMPGLPILRSRDLVNWRFVSYACERLDLGPEFRLEDGKEVYGQGIWAPCLRYHRGTFYVFANVNKRTTQLFRATNPAGPWTHSELKSPLHDLSVLFDDDGKTYVVWGYAEIYFAELNADFTDIKPETKRVLIPRGRGMGEGCHFLKIAGKYYIFSANWDPACYMMCARADKPEGPYEVTSISAEETHAIGTGWRLRGDDRQGPPFSLRPPEVNRLGRMPMHQGAIVDTASGEWWGYSMMGYNSVGRLTCLSPITWANGWPYFGLPGNLGRSPRTWVKPNTGHTDPPAAPYERSDDFSGTNLKPVWQWNHVPVDSKWSLVERPGFLRLHSLPARDFWSARNTLTQRSVGPESTPTAVLDTAGMQPGDMAGLALLNFPYAWIGIARTADGLLVRQFDQTTGVTSSQSIHGTQVWLRARCDFETEKATFSFSTNGAEFKPLGGEFTMVYQGKTFQGVRYALFHFNTGDAPGGYADFDSLTVDEPRPRGLATPIPIGRVVTFKSRGDDTVLAVKNGVLATLATSDRIAATPAARFRVVDRGLGRVALQSMADNGYISVSGAGILGDVRIKLGEPGEAETFQWEDMLRGDVALLSLATNRYLLSTPNDCAPLSANHPGPRPDRKDGSCFIWRSEN